MVVKEEEDFICIDKIKIGKKGDEWTDTGYADNLNQRGKQEKGHKKRK